MARAARRFFHPLLGAAVALVAVLGCRGTTAVLPNPYLADEAAGGVPVYFIRPEPRSETRRWIENNFGSTNAREIEISLDGVDLMTLRRGDYTRVSLAPGSYEMTVGGWDLKPGEDNSLFDMPDEHGTAPDPIWVTRNYVLDLNDGQVLYLLITQEEESFWEAFTEHLLESNPLIDEDVDLGGNFSIGLKVRHRGPGRGYLVRLVSRARAAKLVKSMTPVGGAHDDPLIPIHRGPEADPGNLATSSDEVP